MIESLNSQKHEPWIGLRILVIVLLALVGTGLAFANTYAQEILLSPLKQVQSGIFPQDVKCNDGLVLVIRPESASPACTNPSTGTKLLEHGWITPEKFASTHPHAVQPGQHNTIADSSVKTNTGEKNDILSHNNTITKIMSKTISNSTSKNAVNSTSHSTTISDTGNDTLTPDYIFKLYQTSYVNGTVPQLAQGVIKPQDPVSVNYTATSNHPGTIKILMIGISPYPLKVGDMPIITMTWQNISNKPIYQGIGEFSTPLDVTMLPSDSVTGAFVSDVPYHEHYHSPINPGQIDTVQAYFDPVPDTISPSAHNVYFTPGFYHILKPGILQVTLHLYLDGEGDDTIREKVQFNLTATQ